MTLPFPTLLRYFALLVLLPFLTQHFLGAYLAGRYDTLLLLLRNAPDKLPEVAAFKSHEIKFADRVRNCEDVHLVPGAGLAILSCDPGRDGWNAVMGGFARNRSAVDPGELMLYTYRGPGPEHLARIRLVGHPSPHDFHPLGISLHAPTNTLFVVNHAYNGSGIDVFDLQHEEAGSQPLAQYGFTITHPLIQTPNAILPLSHDELLVTTDHYFLIRNGRLLPQIESYAAPPGGTVLHVKLEDRRVIDARMLARLPFANGIAALNDTAVAVASTSTPGVWIYDITPGTKDLVLRGVIKTPFAVDNLSVDGNGVLLMSGHPHPPTLSKTAQARTRCVDRRASGLDEKEGEEKPGICRFSLAPSWVSEWTPEKGRRDLYVSGHGFGSSTMAVRDVKRGFGIVTGLYEPGLLVWKE